MKELTIGELRYINEAVNLWKMLVMRIQCSMDHMPESLTDKLNRLEQDFQDQFRAYYQKCRDEGSQKSSDALLDDFEEKWEKIHPDFYDFRKLFAECSPEDLKAAEDMFPDYLP
ncbi:MAG: hypothetical protein K6E50_03685 [Lachnospiraceae bacterium]|nr:hypothetical protein [Lachnospiraceae bacterium]